MTTFNTGNPIGSTDAKDLSDNAENFDVALGTLDATWTDRLGVTRDSFEGRLAKGSFYRVGDFTTGYTLINMRQTLEHDGHEYSWAGTFPKVVAAGATPATSGGIGAGAWVDRTDMTLRADLNVVVKLFNSVAEMISDTALQVGQVVETIGYYSGELTELRKPISGNRYVIVSAGTGTEDGGSFINLSNGLQAKGLFPDGVNVCQFGAVGDFGNTTDSTTMFQKAMDFVSEITTSNSNDGPTCKGGRVFIPSGYYIIGNLTWRAYVNLQGEHSSTTFLHPKSGATGYMFDSTATTDLPRAIEISGFTIAPTRNVGVESVSKPVISAFNVNVFVQQCLVRDVKIYNIDGEAFRLGGSQDIEFENVEVRFVTTPLYLTNAYVGAFLNWTNAIKFMACRFENSGASQLQAHRSTHFVACKFEEAQLNVVDPIGLDFIGCDWAVRTAYAVIVGGTGNNRGMRIIGGSVDTGLPIGTGANTANFIQANYNVHLIGVSMNGLAAGGILGDVTITDCHFSNCDRPYATQTVADASFINNNDYNPTNSTGSLTPITRNVSYDASSVIPTTIVADTWYLNNSLKPIHIYLQLGYNTASAISTYEIKTRHDSSLGVSVGYFTHPAGAGVGTDTLSLCLMPGESLYVNWTSGGTGCASSALYR